MEFVTNLKICNVRYAKRSSKKLRAFAGTKEGLKISLGGGGQKPFPSFVYLFSLLLKNNKNEKMLIL